MSLTTFHSQTVPLQESNLIEASAGTGKTYSIAILTIRLLLEKRISIQEILMVTFTKAAVAELETRIRTFVRLAYQASTGSTIKDLAITQIVTSHSKVNGAQETQRILKNAVLFLDETSVLTIHGFCQRTLKEYSFETDQIFGAEAMEEAAFKEIQVDQVNRFWRRNIIILETDLLKYLTEAVFSREVLFEIIGKELSGQQLVPLAPYNQTLLSKQNQNVIIDSIKVQEQVIAEARNQAELYINSNRDRLLSLVTKDTYAQKKFPLYFDDYNRLIDEILVLAEKKYIQKIFKEVLEILEPVGVAKREMKRILDVFSNQIYQFAIDEICKEIKLRKDNNAMLTFDDMIDKLHEAVVNHPNEKLIEAMRKKFLAVFIDEFQDTDKKQYEIFNALFGVQTILFYIGDPKQSIYGWRKAHLNTYFEASRDVAKRYGMDTNYRSSDGIITAQNQFFQPTDDFNTFYYENTSDSIKYNPVRSPLNNDSENLEYNGKVVVPITLSESNNQMEIEKAVTATVIKLLSDENYRISGKGKPRKVRPSDIGILVRGNKQGRKIKEGLSRFGIPAITIDDTKLSETKEAQEILFILRAAIDINASNINKALLTGITGFSINELKSMNEEMVLDQFKLYQYTLHKQGVYIMLMKFITDYNVKTQLLSGTVINGERRLSNILQLLEILHKKQTRSKHTAIELVNWLQKSIEGQTTEGDEFEQRIENDDDAIKIITIHKSKGLEYNIVIAPFLDMNVRLEGFLGFRAQDGIYHYSTDEFLNEVDRKLYFDQQEQENRRLIYVAITRAKFKCFINHNLSSKNNNSSLRPFITEIAQTTSNEIENMSSPEIDYAYSYTSDSVKFPIEYLSAKNFNLQQCNWHKLSYTYLNPAHDWIAKPYAAIGHDAYNDFMFRKLKKGAFTGNLLHYIFERIHFSNSKNWEKIIKQALLRLSQNNQIDYAENLLKMLNLITNLRLSAGDQSFALSELAQENCISEFEFDFKVQSFTSQKLNSLSTPQHPFYVKNFEELEGIMNGKMDLFFEKDGKYYILDWKSNFLGDQLEDYSEAKVLQAMQENNYHLQHHIYTVAICKYLKLRLPSFNYNEHFGGVIYLFVRGIRADQSLGIFYTKPNWDVIEALSECLG